MKKQKRLLGAIVCIAVTLLCTLPLMSVRIETGEIGTLVVRGYNLMEFSAWGCIPIIAPLLIILLHLCRSKAIREAGVLLLLAGNAICYVHSFNAAKTWLTEISGSGIVYHPGAMLYPLALGLLLVADTVLCRTSIQEMS